MSVCLNKCSVDDVTLIQVKDIGLCATFVPNVNLWIGRENGVERQADDIAIPITMQYTPPPQPTNLAYIVINITIIQGIKCNKGVDYMVN